jgi:hypothetical protein
MITPQQKIRNPKYCDGLLSRFKIILLGTSSTTSVDIHGFHIGLAYQQGHKV